MLIVCHQAQALSEFDEFRSYPYLDRAYRAAEARDWAEVQRLMEHLIGQVPGNIEAYRLLSQALEKQGNLDGAVAALGALDANLAAVQINALRRDWIADGHASADQVDQWLAETSGAARSELWRTRGDYLRATRGAPEALAWLRTVQAKGDGLALDRYRATLAERVQDWDQVIDALVPHALENVLEEDDWRRLAIAMVQSGNEKGVNAMVAALPDGDIRRFVLKTGADRAIALGYPEPAQRWLKTLEDSGQLLLSDEDKLLQTSLALGDTAKVRELAPRHDMDCLTLVDWLSHQGDPGALATFAECDPADNPESWLVLADRLDAIALLETTALPRQWQPRQNAVLLDRYRADGHLTKALALLQRQPQTAATLRERAELTQRLSRPLAAAKLWERHYLMSGETHSLDQASYLYLSSDHPLAARQILQQALLAAPDRLSPQALDRLAFLYREDTAKIPDGTLAILIQQPRLGSMAREGLLEQLARQDRCALVKEFAVSPSPPWGPLGICSRDRPGQAARYFQRALAQRLEQQAPIGDVNQARKRLAYALFAAGDPSAAWREWQAVEVNLLEQQDRLAGARSALASGDTEEAWRWWNASSASAEHSLLGARIALANGEPPTSLALATDAISQAAPADSATFEGASQLAQQAGDDVLARRWLEQAQAAAPDSPRLARELGLTLASSDTQISRQQAIPLLERARHAYPEDIVSASTLGALYAAVGDNARALTRLEQAIDLQPLDLRVGDDSAERMAERRYRQRRQHESLTRRDRITLSSSWSPASPTPGIRSDSEDDSASGHDINTQILQWDHALGHDPLSQGRQLAGYVRTIFGGDDRDDFMRGRSLGMGLRAKPLARHNINLYAEVFAESQKNDDQHTDIDLLLRASGSLLDQGGYSNEWRPTEDHWHERSLYLDGAWWTQRGDVQLFSRYRQGYTLKLPTDSAQTLMPYASLQATSHDTDGWDEDVRVAAGLRWELWYDEDHYNAFRRKLSVSTEYQQSLGGNLYDGRDGWMIHLEWSL
ncbi:hypothetical protein KUV41_03765 [Halomonas sp. DP8Y7-1]|uniref:NfrA family protein n=1 Tax=Halomonas sp. DP8Y7-1 TaxID=2859078 RepID=UPI001C970467|nr:hypothetical protein [Halomonas sp. DP8Y7-1]MBY6028464.1 hypothetical protein [Halomonas sp. DP8Y7-1]